MTIKKLETSMLGHTNPTTFGLEDGEVNKKKLQELKKKGGRKIATVTLGTGEQVDLIRTGEDKGNIYIEYQGELGYYVHYETYKYPYLPVKSFIQTKLWKSKSLPISNTFSPNVFFKVIQKQTGAVLCDFEHTDDGIDFWKRRLREALTKNLNVALVDFGSKSYEQVRSKKRLEELTSQSWGGGMQLEQFKQKRWLIWK